MKLAVKYENAIKKPGDLSPRTKWLRDYYFEGVNRKWNNEYTGYTTGTPWDCQFDEMTYYIVPENHTFLSTFTCAFKQLSQVVEMPDGFWDKSLVPQEVIDHELEVQVALMDNDPKMAAKPQAIKEKIASGKINAFYKENCLLQQEFVRSDLFSGDVAGYIADAAKKLGGKVKFVDAIHYVKGEGIEKKEEDFAAEVAAQMNMGK